MHFAGHEQIVSAFLSNSHRGSLFSHPWWEGTLHKPLQNNSPRSKPQGCKVEEELLLQVRLSIWWAVKTARPGPKAAMILSLLNFSLLVPNSSTELNRIFFIHWKINTLHLPIPVYCLWKWENATGIYVPQIKLHENYLLPPLPKSILSNRHFTYAFNYCVDQLTHRSEGGDELQQSNKRFTGMDTHIRVL